MLTLSFETFAKLPNLRESGSDIKDTLSMRVTCLPKVLLLTFNILLLLEVTDYFDLEEKETFTLVLFLHSIWMELVKDNHTDS